MIRLFLFLVLVSGSIALCCGCTTPQERSGVNPKPFNTPANWERDPYGGQLRN